LLAVNNTGVGDAFSVQPKKVHVLCYQNPSRRGSERKMLSVCGSHQAGITRGSHVNFSMSKGCR
jgi:hypothetical protein